MDADRALRIEEVFAGARGMEPGERAAFLDRSCAGDPELRAEVVSLLEADSDAKNFMESPACEASPLLGAAPVAAAFAPGSGTRLGAYEIVRPIASGGMGTVYEAIQEQPRRTVALKVMHAGLASASARGRFRWEAELLGRLSHPAIARVFEAGMWEGGAVHFPWFAMELVPGARAITTYAREAGLSVRQRIELFLEVCDAVHHGHQRGVIHRDLKPANLLVDAAGRPKVIDFGVARATDAEALSGTPHTRAGQLLGTLQYMSPEQCESDPREVDTRSDVYALGMVLYELLCERRPYDLSDLPLAAAARVIRDTPPRRPSSLRRELKGDLETILERALEKERDRRYASAAALAEDLRLFLEGAPIQARRDSGWYVLSRTLRRHKRPVAAALLVFLVVVAGLGASLHFWKRAADDRDAAIRSSNAAHLEAVKSAHLARFFGDVLILGSPGESQGLDTTLVRRILDRADARLDTELAAAPDMQAEIREVIAASYMGLGMYDRAEELTRRNLDHYRSTHGADDPATLAAMFLLAKVYYRTFRLNEAEELQLAALAAAERAQAAGRWSPRADQLDLHEMWNNIGSVLCEAGRLEEAEPLLQRALAHVRTLEHPVNRETEVMIAHNLANCLSALERQEEAVALCREALALATDIYDETYYTRLSLLESLGDILLRQGDEEAAAPLIAEQLELHRKVYGDDHERVLGSASLMARLLESQGRWEEATPLRREISEKGAVLVPAGHRTGVDYLGHYGNNLLHVGRYAEAEELLLETWQTLEPLLGPEDPDVVRNLERLVELYERWDKPEQAAEIRELL